MQLGRLKDPPPFNITLQHGMMESNLSRTTAEWIASPESKIAVEFKNWLKDVQWADDCFFPTIGTIASHELDVNGTVLQGVLVLLLMSFIFK